MQLLGNKSKDYTSSNKGRTTNIVEQTNTLKDKFSSITTSQEKIIVEVKHLNKKISMTREQYEFFKKTQEFRRRLRNGETREDIMAEAFAVCREATKRKLGMFHYDVQVEAAAAMGENGIIAEMKTGEGKTLVQILTAYLYALEATKSENPSEWKSVHVITSNEYLAKRDRADNAKVFTLLGLSSGYIEEKSQRKKDPIGYKKRKKLAYRCDIVYGTAKTIAFDYLDDNYATKKENRYINRGMYHAIVDEADDILLDQATKPLILSGSALGMNNSDSENITDLSTWAINFIMGTKGVRENKVTCEIIDQKKKATNQTTSKCVLYHDQREVSLTESLTEEIYGKNPDLTDIEVQTNLMEREMAVKNAILAMYYYKRGKHYELKEKKSIGSDGKEEIVYEVVLIDLNTGRAMPGTRIKNGIQEAIEAKEKFLNPDKKIIMSNTKITIAQCTYPDFFSQYETGINGMTGTSDEKEFESLYHLKTYIVPTHKKNIRIDEADELYVSSKGKYKAIVREILRCRKTMQPVLVGTTSVIESDELCKLLDQYGVRYQRLDAVNNKDEDSVIASAGLLGSVTIATNMAGRGTDIKLGPAAREAGGLYVIGTSKNLSRRIDNQLRGRASRQGEPGKSKFFMSLDDEIVKTRFRGPSIEKYQQNQPEDQKITSKIILTMVEQCQNDQENHDKNERYTSLIYDEKAFRIHRTKMYEERRKIVDFEPKTFVATIKKIINSYIDELFINYSLDDLNAKIGHLIDVESCFNENIEIFKSNVKRSLKLRFQTQLLSNPINFINESKLRMLKVVDTYWISHMETLRDLQGNIGRDKNSTIDDYEREANQLFTTMKTYIRNELLTYVLDPTLQLGSYKVNDSLEYTSIAGVKL